MKNKSILLAACLVASLGVVSCSSKNPASIYISSENDVHSLEVGQTLQLKAEVSPKGVSQDVIWESGNVDIATINETGLVTTLNEGNVIISATSKIDNSIKGEYALIVTKSSATVKPTNITLVASKTTIDINESLKLVVRVTPENASDEVTFSTSDSSTVSCSATGDIKGLKAGKATITATSKVDTTIKGSIEITVNASQSVDGGNYDDLPFATHEEYINAEEINIRIITINTDDNNSIDFIFITINTFCMDFVYLLNFNNLKSLNILSARKTLKSITKINGK